MDALLRNEPLFVAVVEDEPSLRAPLRGGAPEGPARRRARRGGPGRAAAAEPAALALRAARLRRRGPGPRPGARGDPRRTCRRATRSSATASSSPPWPGRRGSGASARRRPPARGAAGRGGLRPRRVGGAARSARGPRRSSTRLSGRLRERHGSDVDVLRNAQAPGADRARVCAMTIALYSELVALPPADGGAHAAPRAGPGGAGRRRAPAPDRPLNAGRAQPFFAFQASRTCASRSGSMPAFSLACRSAGSVFHQASVSVRGLRERLEGEAGGDGLLVAAAARARGVPGGGDPDRHVAPRR